MFKRLTKTYSENVPAITFSKPPMAQSWRQPKWQASWASFQGYLLHVSHDHIYSLPLSIWRKGFWVQVNSIDYQLKHLKTMCFLCNRRLGHDHQNALESNLLSWEIKRNNLLKMEQYIQLFWWQSLLEICMCVYYGTH